MIEVEKLNGERFCVNADHIESVEAHPDTTLILLNGKRFVIKDSVEDVVRKVIEYQRAIRSERMRGELRDKSRMASPDSD